MAEPITLRTGSEAAGQRLDAFLAGAVPELTRSGQEGVQPPSWPGRCRS